jgi:hypothetical protein
MSAEQYEYELDELVKFFMQPEVIFYPKPWFNLEEETK